MQLKENLKIKLYTLLTFINYGLAIIVLNSTNYVSVTILFLGFIINQLLLIWGVDKITLKNKSSGTGTLQITCIFIGKFGVLVIAILYAVQKTPQSGLYCLLFYIFQLIILVLSIKRIPKKLRD